MKRTLLTTVSAIALLAAGPAFADSYSHSDSAKPGSKAAAESSTGSITKDAEKAWDSTKEEASEAASDISEATEKAYEDAKQALNDNDNDAEFEKISVDMRNTATGMIGNPVFNTNGERIAKIHDIILDHNGNAMMVVMADGEFTGLGKLVAFDYNIITEQSKSGDVIASLNEKTIDAAANFSYDQSDRSGNVQVVPNNGYSVNQLLNGELVNPQGQSLANVDNVVFRNGKADQVVVSFGQTLGLGGEQAAISYSEADLSKNGDGIDMKLSKNETLQFQSYKRTALN